MSRKFARMALLAVFPAIVGMGGGGGSLTEIPKPEELHTAELADRNGTVTTASQFSCNGNVFLRVERGGGVLLVPFSTIKTVKLGEQTGSKINVEVSTADNKTIQGEVSRALKCTGATEFGNFIAEIRNIESIEFVDSP